MFAIVLPDPGMMKREMGIAAMREHRPDVLTSQAPLQLNSLTGTYATSAYLAALKKSSKDLETLAKDIESFSQKLKSDEKLAAVIGESGCRLYLC